MCKGVQERLKNVSYSDEALMRERLDFRGSAYPAPFSKACRQQVWRLADQTGGTRDAGAASKEQPLQSCWVDSISASNRYLPMASTTCSPPCPSATVGLILYFSRIFGFFFFNSDSFIFQTKLYI